MSNPNFFDSDLLVLVQLFCNATRATNDPLQILVELEALRLKLGIRGVFSAYLPSRREKLTGHIRLHGWNSDWLQSYDDNDYVHADPVVKYLRTATNSFLWSATFSDADLNETERQVLSHAHDHGFADGYTVPFFGRNLRRAFVSFAMRGHVLAHHEKDALDAVARRLHDWLKEHVDGDQKDEFGDLENPLAPQEIETLYFLMKGNNYKQIAYLTGLSIRTVEAYAASAIKKLKAHNRVEAIFRAIKLGFINHE